MSYVDDKIYNIPLNSFTTVENDSSSGRSSQAELPKWIERVLTEVNGNQWCTAEIITTIPRTAHNYPNI